MSAITERFLVCDECGEPYGVDSRFLSIKSHRENAKAEGWKFKGGKDYCNECVSSTEEKGKQ